MSCFNIELPHLAWGVHLSLDLKHCNENVKWETKLRAFADILVKSIQMEQFGETQCVHFGKDDKKGFTLSGLLTTSNYCMHLCDDTGDAFLDIFSCKNIDANVVLRLVNEWFEPDLIVHNLYIRGRW